MVANRTESAFIAFDVETTGLHPGVHRIVEVASVRFLPGNRGEDVFTELIDPGG